MISSVSWFLSSHYLKNNQENMYLHINMLDTYIYSSVINVIYDATTYLFLERLKSSISLHAFFQIMANSI